MKVGKRPVQKLRADKSRPRLWVFDAFQFLVELSAGETVVRIEVREQKGEFPESVPVFSEQASQIFGKVLVEDGHVVPFADNAVDPVRVRGAQAF